MASSRRIGTNESISTYGAAGYYRNYTALATWEADTDVNLVTNTISYILECYDDASSFNDYVLIDGATCNSSYFRIIRPASGQGHDGTPNNGVNFISTTDIEVFYINEEYSQVQDIIAKVNCNSANTRTTFFIGISGSTSTFVGCIANRSINNGSQTARGFATTGGGYFINCLAIGCESQNFLTIYASAYNTYFYNCTSVNGTLNGFRFNISAGTQYLLNCLASGNTSGDFSKTNTVSPIITYSASGDNTADDWGGAGNRISQTFTFVNTGTDNFHLTSTDAGARNYGADLSATFDDDIDKQIRPGESVWDIGFDEYKVVGYNLTVDPGSYAMTGIVAGTLATRMVSALPTTYAITGITANTLVNRMVLASPANYTVTGIDMGLLATRLLNVNSGSYVISGVDTTLAHGYFISADGGVYGITGNAATLLAQRLISADVGTYLISGIAAQVLTSRLLNTEIGIYGITGFVADLVHTGVGAYILETEPGSYLVIGTQAGLLATRIFNVDSGGYTLTGISTGLLTTRLLNANPGNYGISGVNTTLLTARLLIADNGNYILTGFDATLFHTGVGTFSIDATSGSYALTGSVAGLLTARVLVTEIGTYALTGKDATILAKRLLLADPGIYVVTGVDIYFSRGFNIVANSGEYLLTGIDDSLLATRLLNATPGVYILTGLDTGLIKSMAWKDVIIQGIDVMSGAVVYIKGKIREL